MPCGQHQMQFQAFPQECTENTKPDCTKNGGKKDQDGGTSGLPLVNYSMFDDAEGDNWQTEPDDWWHQDEEAPEPPADVAYEATSLERESVQAALNARLRRTTRLTFFDVESGAEDMQLEPDDFAIVTGIVDRRGWPEFSKAAKFAGAWAGMVFKRGHLCMGYYRDGFKLEVSLALHLPWPTLHRLLSS